MTQPLPAPIVECTHEDGIALVALNRPEALNAISMELVEALNAVLDSVERARSRCVILTGRGRAFCAGGDISAHLNRPAGTPPYDLGEVLNKHFNPLLMRLMRLPSPLVTAVNGPAAGAGVGLALAGDVVIAARGASFECGFARIGLMPDLGATWLLPRLVGRARAHAMMLLDERISAETAEAWGLIYACVDYGLLQIEASKVAQTLAAAAPAALAATRRATLAASDLSLEEALAAEAEAQRPLGFSADFAEGVAAFFARRPANFRGE